MARLTTALLIACLALTACAGVKVNTGDRPDRAEPGADPFPRDKTR